MSAGLLGHWHSKKGNRETKFKFGSSAVKSTVTAHEWLAVAHVMLFIGWFVRSFIHSFIHSFFCIEASRSATIYN